MLIFKKTNLLIIRRHLIFIILLFICLLSISSAGASEFSNDTVSDVNPIEVELITNEHLGFYDISNTKLNVQVQDKAGNNVTGGVLTFVDVFGKNYTVNVKDGLASSFVPLKDTGKFNILCLYDGEGIYQNANTTLLLNVPITDTACHNIAAAIYGDNVYFSGNIISEYAPYIGEASEGDVTLMVNGQKIGSCPVDVRGNFNYVWKTSQNLIGQSINVSGFYKDDLKHFNPSTFSKSLTFNSLKNTKIISDINFIDNSRALVSGIVEDEDGNAVVGGTITINNIYSIPVDANGKFRFYISDKRSAPANYKVGVFNWGSKADITVNQALMEGIKHTPLVDTLIDLCKQGTPYIKFGNDNGKTIVLSSGTHGCEIASQVAMFKLIDVLANYGGEINGAIYIFPSLFPEAIANNSRTFNGVNMNSVANIEGMLSNNFIKFAKSVNAVGLGDFHCTRHNDGDLIIPCGTYTFEEFVGLIKSSEFPGTSSVLSTLSPCYESYLIGKFISDDVKYSLVYDQDAGVAYSGAIDDNANLQGIPAVTCEALTNHGIIEYGSPEVSFNMIRSFLKYFGFDLDEMISIPFTGGNLVLMFTSPYNYISSFKTVYMPGDYSYYPHINSISTRAERMQFNESPNSSGTVTIEYSYSSFSLLSFIFNIILAFINFLIFLLTFLLNF